MIDVKKVVLTNEEMQKCREFSEKSAKSQQRVEFGQHTTKERPIEEIARDNMIGKIAEVAFQKILRENYGIDVGLDWKIYDRGIWDVDDVEYNGWRIDVKATRQGGRWMLIEWSKLDFRQKGNNLSHIYAMFTVGWNRSTNQPDGTACFKGVVSLKKLNNTTETTKVLHKGRYLPGVQSKVPLQADNYGILFEDLCTDFDVLVKALMKAPPASMVNEYRNPYNGKTTLEILDGK